MILITLVLGLFLCVCLPGIRASAATLTINITSSGDLTTSSAGDTSSFTYSYNQSEKTLKLTTGNFKVNAGSWYGTMTVDSDFSDGTLAGPVINNGTIDSGSFSGSIENYGTIQNGTFHNTVVNRSSGSIRSGIYYGSSLNNYGTITGGTIHSPVENNNGGIIAGGSYVNTVNNNSGGIISDGSFTSQIINNIGGIVKNGTCTSLTNYGSVENIECTGQLHNLSPGKISGGIYSGIVYNNTGAQISGGTFTKSSSIQNGNGAFIYSGSFEGSMTALWGCHFGVSTTLANTTISNADNYTNWPGSYTCQLDTGSGHPAGPLQITVSGKQISDTSFSYDSTTGKLLLADPLPDSGSSPGSQSGSFINSPVVIGITSEPPVISAPEAQTFPYGTLMDTTPPEIDWNGSSSSDYSGSWQYSSNGISDWKDFDPSTEYFNCSDSGPYVRYCLIGPGDTFIFSSAARIIVEKADPVTVWPSAQSAAIGSLLGSSSLSGGETATDPATGTRVSGTFSWDNANRKLDQANNHGYKVIFTPDAAYADNYTTPDHNVNVYVTGYDYTVNWPSATVVYGTRITDSLLTGGSADYEGNRLEGSFSYTDASVNGTVPPVGPGQKIPAVYNPSAAEMAYLNPKQGDLSLTVTDNDSVLGVSCLISGQTSNTGVRIVGGGMTVGWTSEITLPAAVLDAASLTIGDNQSGGLDHTTAPVLELNGNTFTEGTDYSFSSSVSDSGYTLVFTEQGLTNLKAWYTPDGTIKIVNQAQTLTSLTTADLNTNTVSAAMTFTDSTVNPDALAFDTVSFGPASFQISAIGSESGSSVFLDGITFIFSKEDNGSAAYSQSCLTGSDGTYTINGISAGTFSIGRDLSNRLPDGWLLPESTIVNITIPESVNASDYPAAAELSHTWIFYRSPGYLPLFGSSGNGFLILTGGAAVLFYFITGRKANRNAGRKSRKTAPEGKQNLSDSAKGGLP